MKIKFVFSLVLFSLLSSCSSLLTYPVYRWSFRNLKDSFGHPTGVYCAYFTEKKIGRFSNVWDPDRFAVIDNILFSKDLGLHFEVSPVPWFFDVSDVPVSILLPDDSTAPFKASYRNAGYCGVVCVPFSDSLVDCLCRDGCYFAFRIQDSYLCRFEFPYGFKYAWNRLSSSR